MAKTWDNFFPYVQPHVPGCPEIVIQTHLQEAAAEYIGRSELWRFDIESDFTSKNTPDYEIDVPTGAVLENILTLFVNGSATKRVTDRHFQLSNTKENSAPSAFSIYQDNQIRFLDHTLLCAKRSRTPLQVNPQFHEMEIWSSNNF